MQVLYDPVGSEQLHHVYQDGRVTMQFVGKAAGREVDFLFDSGTSTNYVSSAFAKLHGLTVKPSNTNHNVQLGTGTSVSVQGECSVHIKLGKLSDKVDCYVLDMVTDFQMILGDTWLNMVKAVFDYDSKKCIIRKNNRRFTLSSCTRTMLNCHKLSSRGKKEPPMLSVLRVKRALKRGNKIMMVQLTKLKLDSQISADKKLADLLKEYENDFRFELPCGLPSEWNVQATPFWWNRGRAAFVSANVPAEPSGAGRG
jgi:hypothetical protein